MNLIWLLIAIIIGLVIFEVSKHHFRQGLIKYAILVIVIIVGLMIISTYIDISQIFETDGFFVKTGNMIKDSVGNQVSTIQETNNSIINKVSDSTSDVFNTG